MFPTILLVALVLIVIYGVVLYNGLVTLRRQTQNAFGQIDVQLKRRYELIPNLMETVMEYMRHESEPEKLLQARTRALSARSVGEKASAESQVSQALSGIFALSESYPDLHADENLLSLQEELKSTENKIAFARHYYNDIVTAYNTRIETFPSSIFASSGGFTPKEMFEIEVAVQRQPVAVKT